MSKERLSALTEHIRSCQEAANRLDSERRALRAIVQPVLNDIADYDRILWRRLYDTESPSWGDWVMPDDEHPAYRMTAAEIHARRDQVRKTYAAQFGEYERVKAALTRLEQQIKAAAAEIDSLTRVPLKHARKAPKDSRGKRVSVDDLFSKGGCE